MTNHAQQLREKIDDRSALVGIIGLGYVGLPLALAFTEKGFNVLGFDTDPKKVDKINRGESYIKHLDPTRLTRAIASPGAEALGGVGGKSEMSNGVGDDKFEIRNSKSEIDPGDGKLEATSDFSRLSEPDAILICVPTPLGPHKEPDLQYVESSAHAIKKTLRPGQLIILESTTYPGTTDDLLLPILESPFEPGLGVSPALGTAAGTAAPQDIPEPLVGQASRLPCDDEIRNSKFEIPNAMSDGKSEIRNSKFEIPNAMSDGKSEIRNSKFEISCGVDFFLAFSPEREDPGNPSFGTTNTPKVVGGVDDTSGDLAQSLYDQIVDSTVRVSSARVAEAAKLTENIFRSVNIALVNELKVIYDRLGIDIWDVLDAAATKPFGFMRFNPGPGLGGHCIPLDPFYLAWRAREAGVPTKFIELAGEINTAMPGYVIDKLQAALNEHGKAMKGAKILVLGLAYKPDIDDPRESPAFEIIDRLLKLGAEVSYHDPHISVAPSMRSWPDLPTMESQPLTPDTLAAADATVLVTDHAAVDYDLVLEHAPILIDTRGVYRDHNGKVHPA